MDKTVVILAGGASSRMGRDKAKLPYGDKTLLEYMISIYSKSFDRIILSVDRLNRFDFPNAEQVVDEYSSVGPMAGIYSVFTKTDATEFFLTATDIPFGDPELARKIMEFGEGYSACVLKRNSGYYEPLFAMYNKECMDEVKYCLENGEYSFKGLFKRIALRTLNENELAPFSPKPFEEIFINTNSPKEYYKALAKMTWNLRKTLGEAGGIIDAVDLLLDKGERRNAKSSNFKVNVISTKYFEPAQYDIFSAQLMKMGVNELNQIEVTQSIETIMEALSEAVVNEVSLIIVIDKDGINNLQWVTKALEIFGAPILFNSVFIGNSQEIIGSRLGGIPVIAVNSSYESNVGMFNLLLLPMVDLLINDIKNKE